MNYANTYNKIMGELQITEDYWKNGFIWQHVKDMMSGKNRNWHIDSSANKERYGYGKI